MDAFIPKQVTPYGPSWLDYIQGAGSSDAAKYALSLAPPITATSVVHDNGCGTGAVTSLIANASTHPSQIHATDIHPSNSAAVEQKAAKNGWGFVKAATVDAADLARFDNDTFTHSVNNLLIHGAKDPVKVAREVYRTVKPSSAGGTAIFSTWAVEVHKAFEVASEVTRGEDIPLRMKGDTTRNSKEWLEKQLKDGGFTSIEISEKIIYVDVDDLEKWCGVMWGQIGVPASGWTQADEENWDKAVEVAVEQIKKKKEVEIREHGGVRLAMLEYVAIARK